MAFEWDEGNNRVNVEKHGVSFQTASRIFDGPVLTAQDGRFDYGEVRENSIGSVDSVLVIVVTHTDRNGVMRIISARPAKRLEKVRYAQALQARTQS